MTVADKLAAMKDSSLVFGMVVLMEALSVVTMDEKLARWMAELTVILPAEKKAEKMV